MKIVSLCLPEMVTQPQFKLRRPQATGASWLLDRAVVACVLVLVLGELTRPATANTVLEEGMNRGVRTHFFYWQMSAVAVAPLSLAPHEDVVCCVEAYRHMSEARCNRLPCCGLKRWEKPPPHLPLSIGKIGMSGAAITTGFSSDMSISCTVAEPLPSL